jgi:hypothetical protein
MTFYFHLLRDVPIKTDGWPGNTNTIDVLHVLGEGKKISCLCPMEPTGRDV